MVVPDHIVHAAEDGDIAVVEAFLDEAGPGAINELGMKMETHFSWQLELNPLKRATSSALDD